MKALVFFQRRTASRVIILIVRIELAMWHIPYVVKLFWNDQQQKKVCEQLVRSNALNRVRGYDCRGTEAQLQEGSEFFIKKKA